VFDPQVEFLENKKMVFFKIYLYQELWVIMFNRFAKIFGFTQWQKNSERLMFANKKAKELVTLFEHFTCNEWIFETRFIESVGPKMSEEEKRVFFIDPRCLDWEQYCHIYAFGLMKFIIKQDVGATPELNRNSLIQKNQDSPFNDIRFTYTHGQRIVGRDPRKMMEDLLNSPRVQAKILEVVYVEAEKGKKQTPKELFEKYYKKARGYINEMCSTFDPTTIKSTMYFSHKIWKRLFD